MQTETKARLPCDKRTSTASGRRPIGLFPPIYFLYFPIFYNDLALFFKCEKYPNRRFG